LHIPVASHEHALSLVASVVLLVLFGLSIPATLKGETGEQGHLVEGSAWPLWLVATVLLAAAIGSAFVADWFVGSLTPALHVLHMSEAFAGFVVVALAGNAVENVVGISLMAKDRPTVAVSVIVQSPLQIIYVLFPAIVLLSTVLGWGTFSLVLSPVLLVVLVLAALLVTVVVLDGESTWLEGASLIALYVVIAAAFWWG
jgi:Ca2+:H+ antiporter